MTDEPRLPLSCARCNRVVQCKPTPGGNPRPPAGWTLVDSEHHWCGECWDDVYVPRAVTCGVQPANWDAFRAVLNPTFAAVRSIANWAYGALCNSEPPRDPTAEKMPKKPAVYLYGLAKEWCPFFGLLPASIANAVLRQVESDYSADRYEVNWTGAKSARNYRYPAPVPIPAQSWSLEKRDKEYVVTLLLAGGGRTEVPLFVRRHQRAILDRIIATPLLRGACKLIEHRSYADGKPNARENSNGSRFRSSIRLMISYYAVREGARKQTEDQWSVRTCADSLLVAMHGDDEAWRLHADHARRIAVRHDKHGEFLGRLSDDRKAETRKPKREAKPRLAMLSARSERDHNRLRSACHEISSQLVNVAKRRGVAKIVYHDGDKSFCASFPWSMLKSMVDQKCQAAKIAFEHANGSPPKKKRQPLAK